jgi:pilus assembly protein CpaB
MSSNPAAISPQRGNRKFIMMAIALGLLGALLVYVATSRQTGSETTGGAIADTPVVVARVDIPARAVVTRAMLDVKLVPSDSRGLSAYSSVDAVLGQATRFPLAAGEQVLPSKLVDYRARAPGLGRSLSYVIPEGKRGFAINVSSVQNAGGLVLPGDYVDIIVIYDVKFAAGGGASAGGREKVDSFLVQTLMQNIEVLAVSQQVVDVVPEWQSEPAASPDGHRVRNSEGQVDAEARTVTLALSLSEAQRLYLAESNGRIRLAVRSYGDDDSLPIDYATKIELFPPNLPNPFQLQR